MLKDSLYTISRVIGKSDSTVSVGIFLDPGHPIFDGHFPGNPITPGSVMVQIIKELVRDQLGRDLRLATARSIKFLDILVPDANVELVVKLALDITRAPEIPIKATIEDPHRTFMKLSGAFIDES